MQPRVTPHPPVEKKLLHYLGKAIADYKMIQSGDRILVCLSGGKDSYTLLRLLKLCQMRAKPKFEIFSFTLDQGQPGWDDSHLRAWLEAEGVAYEIGRQDTYSVVTDKIPENKSYCSLCSRMRRGHIYKYAREHGFNKVALGHHRDDLIQTLLLSIFYRGDISSMPPKLLSDDKQTMLIRPMVYCQEADIKTYAQALQFPIIPCNLCGSQENLARKKVGKLIETLAQDNPKIPSNILHALSQVKPSHLMDKSLWDFAALDAALADSINE
jgi:tRNA 2-thiocytidine biosynthesis protein TtcA